MLMGNFKCSLEKRLHVSVYVSLSLHLCMVGEGNSGLEQN